MTAQNHARMQQILVSTSICLLILLAPRITTADCPANVPGCTCVLDGPEFEELLRRLGIGPIQVPPIDLPAPADAFELLLAPEFYAPEAVDPGLTSANLSLLPITSATRPLPQPYVEPDPAIFAPYTAPLIPEPSSLLLALLAASFAATLRPRQRV
jgi:hypothetical protein